MDNLDNSELEKRGFIKLDRLAEGSYGVVYSGIEIKTGLKVAMKKMKRQTHETTRDGIHFTTIRELKLLGEIRHDYILGVVSVIVYPSDGQYCLWIISEFMCSNLQDVIQENKILTDDTIRNYIHMILKGLEFMHSNWYLHRDLSSSNILVSSSGQLKIADFGFAKLFGDNREMTPEVVTIWYRSPELLFGAKHYGTSVDIWSLGCIIAELLHRGPFLAGDGNTEISQLSTIFAALGTPTEVEWPGLTNLPCYLEFEKIDIVDISSVGYFPTSNPDAVNLLACCWRFCPSKRCTASKALKHKYFLSLHQKENVEEAKIDVDEKLYVKLEESMDMDIEKTYSYSLPVKQEDV